MSGPRRPGWADPADDRALEAELLALSRELDFLPTPDLASRVRARLDAAREPLTGLRRERPRYRVRRSALLAIAALLVLAGVVAAVALGIGGIRFGFVEQVPTAPPAVAPPTVSSASRPPSPPAGSGSPSTPSTALTTPVPPTTPPVGASLGLGRPVPAADAQPLLGFTPLTAPTLPGLGTPDAVYVADRPAGGMLSFVYGVRPGYRETAPGTGVGLLVTQFRADLRGEYFQKLLGPGTTMEQTRVNGEAGYYLSGDLHAFLYSSPATGALAEEPFRLVGTALVWTQSGLTVRIEGDLTLQEAREVAATIR